jgi:penicillin-binding protein 1A
MRRVLAWLSAIILTLLLLVGAGLEWVAWHFGRDLPDHMELLAPDARLWPEDRTAPPLPLAAIPENVIRVFLADHHDPLFFERPRFIPLIVLAGMAAGLRPVTTNPISTSIARDLAARTQLRSIDFQIARMILTHRIERDLPRQRILELYLNEIYLGRGLYGVDAAASAYFSKNLGDLTLGESALLVAITYAPNGGRDAPELWTRRRTRVLERMAAQGWITAGQAAEAAAEPLPSSLQQIQPPPSTRSPS